MENNVVVGYEFINQDIAEKAKLEIDDISSLNEKINMDNPEETLKIYNDIVEKQLLTTEVGIEYLRGIQKNLYKCKTIDNNLIKNIKVNSIEKQNKVVKTEIKADNKGDLSIKNKNHNNKNHNNKNTDKYKEYFHKSLIVIFALIIVIIAMFIITKKSKKIDTEYYKESIANDYISWENELQERESSISEKESQLNQK